MNVKWIDLCNQFDPTNANTVAVPDRFKLGYLLEENRELKKASAEYKARIEKDRYTIDISEASIAMLKREKQDMLYALDEKEGDRKQNISMAPAHMGNYQEEPVRHHPRDERAH